MGIAQARGGAKLSTVDRNFVPPGPLDTVKEIVLPDKQIASAPNLELVEKQHAQMGQRDLARLRRVAAADQRGGARRVVRRAERPPPPVRGREAEAARRQQRGGGQRLVVGQWGQQAGQPRCQHRLAGAGRTDHQHVVAARGGHFERASCAALADDIGEIRRGRCRRAVDARRRDRHESRVGRTGEVRAERGQVGGAVDDDARYERSLGGAVER